MACFPDFDMVHRLAAFRFERQSPSSPLTSTIHETFSSQFCLALLLAFSVHVAKIALLKFGFWKRTQYPEEGVEAELSHNTEEGVDVGSTKKPEQDITL